MDSDPKEPKTTVEVSEVQLRSQASWPQVDRTDSLSTLPEYAETDPQLGKRKSRCPKWLAPVAKQWHRMQWKPELSSWLTSFMFLITIITVLCVFNGQRAPHLPLGLSVNAVISLLGTLMEFFLMIVVSSAIGQSKWFRASNGRVQMNHFYLIDQASRGPWGSLKMLVRRAGDVIGSLGAVLSILALATSTTVQQTLQFETMYPLDGEAHMPIAQFMNGTGSTYQGDVAVSLPRIDIPMLLSPYAGMFSEAKSLFPPPAECSTGNCTWPTYHTMAFCSECVDLSSQLEMNTVLVTPLNTSRPKYLSDNYTLPNGFGIRAKYVDYEDTHAKLPLLNISSTAPVAVPARRRFRSVAFNGTGSVLLTIFAVGAAPGKAVIQPSYNTTGTTNYTLNGTPFAPPVAYECAIRFCFKEMTAKFQNGSLTESVVSTWINETQLEPRFTRWNECSEVEFKPPGTEQTFHTNNCAWRALEDYLGNMFYGNVTSLSGIRPFRKPLSSSPAMQAAFMAMNTTATGFPDLMDNIAAAMTRSLRMLNYQPAAVKGSAHIIEGRFRVQWEWLALPAFELVASLAFLIAVMIETKKSGLVPWTNNILAVLFHGLDVRPGGHAMKESERDMGQTSKGFLVELRDEGDGGQLALEKK